MVDVESRLEEIASELDKPLSEVKEDFNKKCSKLQDRDDAEKVALKKVQNEAKRRLRRLSAQETYQGYILGSGEVREIQYEDERPTLFVNNGVGVLESGKPFRLTMWNDAATKLTLPENCLLEFQGREQEESTEELLEINLSEDAIPKVLDEEEQTLTDFDGALEAFETSLEDLEDYFAEGNELVYTEASVLDLSDGVTKNGRRIMTIDDLSGFTEDYSTTVFIQEKESREITVDSDVAVFGTMYKPDTRWDPETRSRVDEPGRVSITALGLEVQEAY